MELRPFCLRIWSEDAMLKFSGTPGLFWRPFLVAILDMDICFDFCASVLS